MVWEEVERNGVLDVEDSTVRFDLQGVATTITAVTSRSTGE